MRTKTMNRLIAGAGCALWLALLAGPGCIFPLDEAIVEEIIDDVTCAISMCGGESCEGIPTDACCADDAGCELTLGGDYEDDWGTPYSIDASAIDMDGSMFLFSLVSEEGQYAIAENAWSNAFNAGLWSRFDWTWDEDGVLWLCQTAYDAASEVIALATETADASDPANGGCGGFSWSRLGTFALVGSWEDNWDMTHTISDSGWTQSSDFGTSVFDITAWSNFNGYVIAQNGADNEYNPGAWSRFDWLSAEDGSVWFCQTAFDALTETEAMATEAADATDPANSGCGGSSWSQMYPDA